jgi:hypothetical protein
MFSFPKQMLACLPLNNRERGIEATCRLLLEARMTFSVLIVWLNISNFKAFYISVIFEYPSSPTPINQASRRNVHPPIMLLVSLFMPLSSSAQNTHTYLSARTFVTFRLHTDYRRMK